MDLSDTDTLIVVCDRKFLSRQCLKILERYDRKIVLLEPGVPVPEDAIALFTCDDKDAHFPNTWLRIGDAERLTRNRIPLPAPGMLGYIAVNGKRANDCNTGNQRERLVLALESAIGVKRPKKPRKRLTPEERTARNRERRDYYFPC